MSDSKDVLTEQDVAQLLECETSTVQEKARAGDLPGIKFGRSWVFPRSALLQSLHQTAMQNKTPTRLPNGQIFGIGIARTQASTRREPPQLPQF